MKDFSMKTKHFRFKMLIKTNTHKEILIVILSQSTIIKIMISEYTAVRVFVLVDIFIVL